MMLKGLTFISILLVATPFTASEAHALLLSSQPQPGSTVAGPTLDILLRYNSRIDAQRSRLLLRGPQGQSHPLTVAPGDGPAVLTAHMDGLSPGSFILHWEVLSVDGHLSRGDLPFSVSKP